MKHIEHRHFPSRAMQPEINIGRRQPSRNSSVQAQQKIRAIYEWEGCDENSEIFQKVASVLDSEFAMERTAKKKKRRVTATTGTGTTTETSDVEYVHDSDNDSSHASAGESEDDASQDDCYESSFIDDEEDEHDSDSQCSWTYDREDADAADAADATDATDATDDTDAADADSSDCANNASDSQLCTGDNTDTANNMGAFEDDVLQQYDNAELSLFAPHELFSNEELSHSTLAHIETDVSRCAVSDVNDIIAPTYSCDETESTKNQ